MADMDPGGCACIEHTSRDIALGKAPIWKPLLRRRARCDYISCEYESPCAALGLQIGPQRLEQLQGLRIGQRVGVLHRPAVDRFAYR